MSALPLSQARERKDAAHSRTARGQQPEQGGGVGPGRRLPRQVLPSACSRKPSLHSHK